MDLLRRTLTTRGASFLGCGTVLVAAGVLLGQHDVTRIGVLLLALTVVVLVAATRIYRRALLQTSGKLGYKEAWNAEI